MQRQSEAFDAIVVGSGISGGWAAKELTERGLRVLMLERGKNVEHVTDYPSARKAPWEYAHRGGRTHAMEEAYPVLKRDYPLNEKNLDWWVNEKESPYTEVKRFDWYRGYHVGGRSLTWGRQSYRLSESRRNYEAARQDLQFRLREAFAQAETSFQLLTLYQDTIIPQAQLTADSSLASYQTGTADFLSVLTNLSSTIDYEERYHEEMLSYWLAVIKLEELSGSQLLK